MRVEVAVRIGVVVPCFAPFHGGMETYTRQAAAALAAAGSEVTVVTQVPRNSGIRSVEVCDGYTIERHPLPIGSTYDVPSPSAARAAWQSGRFDVVWAHSYHTPLAWLAAERAKSPLVLTPHYHGGGHTRVRQALHRPYRPAGRRLMAASSRIVVDTDAEADLVLRDFPRSVVNNKIAVVPLGVSDPAFRQVPYPSKAPVVLTVARQEPYKRTDLLIRAVAELRRRGVSVRLVVVGNGSALSAYRELADSLGIQDAVTFPGTIDNATLGRWWATASLYATASLHEAFGIGLAEALVTGLPVIASAIPAHREVVTRAGPDVLVELCAEDDSVDDLTSAYANGIARLLSSRGSRRERATRCALPTTADMADQLLDAFTSVRV